MRMSATIDVSHGMCQCGCGQLAPIAPKTWRAKGWVKDEPLRFVHGHNARRFSGPEYRCDSTTGCWIWQHGIDDKGYGRTRVDGNHAFAHRAYYERYRGPIPVGLELDHLCRTPGCVNPDHLEAVTHTENMRRGANAKLTFALAEEIRASGESGPVLAARYGVSVSTISLIRRGVRWKA